MLTQKAKEQSQHCSFPTIRLNHDNTLLTMLNALIHTHVGAGQEHVLEGSTSSKLC